MSKLTHVDERGAARMVDVGLKPRRIRRAVARGRIKLSAEALEAVLEGTVPKGDVIAAARIGGIMAAKRTPELIPLCHHVALTSARLDFEPLVEDGAIEITGVVETVDRTGVEMEALTAVSMAALTLYDMLKAIDKGMVISDIHLVEKVKGGVRTGGVKVVPKGAPPSQPAPAVAPKAEAPDSSALLRPRPEPPRAESESTMEIAEDAEMSVDASMDASMYGLLPPPVPRDPPPPAMLSEDMKARMDMVRPLEEADHAAVRAFLLKDRTLAAYQLGDLDDPFIEHSKWFGISEPDGTLTAVLLWYSGLSMPAILPMGEPEDVQALVARLRATLPRKIFASYPDQHRQAFERYYRPISVKPMIRMGLSRDRWRLNAVGEGVERLTHRDTAAIMHLYRYYPDNFFEPAQLDTGMYFGIRQRGELVSVAGIHVLSEAQDMAVLGNVVTHVDHRGKGLATRTTARVLEAVFGRVGHVALNVQRNNDSAKACYRKFGFTEHCALDEGWMERF